MDKNQKEKWKYILKDSILWALTFTIMFYVLAKVTGRDVWPVTGNLEIDLILRFILALIAGFLTSLITWPYLKKPKQQ